jgi:hypothetical protein
MVDGTDFGSLLRFNQMVKFPQAEDYSRRKYDKKRDGIP